MASEAHAPAQRHMAVTHQIAMTTREKRLVTAPFPVTYAVERGKCTLDLTDHTDEMSVHIVSGDDDGESYVSVTPLEPHDDYRPAMICVTVTHPPTDVVFGEPELK